MGLKQAPLEKLAGKIKGKVLSLGYPDLVAHPETVRKVLGVVSDDLVDNGGWHGLDHKLAETRSTFALLGASLECVDIVASRGVEKVVDLNLPQWLGQFNLVIDPGTIEHCFNIGQALMNAANSVEKGGWIFHCPPMTMLNHGFYNLNPTLFHDFYSQNGWSVEITAYKGEDEYQVPSTQRFTAPAECSLMVLAQRLNDNELKFPIQSKYLKNPMLRKVA